MHFGHNCRHMIPSLKKCRILIKNYNERADMVETKWLDLQNAVAYLGLSNTDILKQITNENIKVKEHKDGKIMLGIKAAWQYDNCYLSSSGGQCMYFEPCDGNLISYIAEISSMKDESDNTKKVSDQKEIVSLENDILNAINM